MSRTDSATRIIAAAPETITESSNVVELHPASIEVYRRKVTELQDALVPPPTKANAGER